MIGTPQDILSRRLVGVVAELLSMFDALDHLAVEPKGAAKARADGIIKMIGPSAVLCSLLQGSERVREAAQTAEMLDLFEHTARERRRAFLDALPVPQRIAVERRAAEAPAGPERVLQLFVEALAGMKSKDLLARWGGGGGLARVTQEIEKLKRGELDLEGLRGAAEAMAPEVERGPEGEPIPAPPLPEQLPAELLGTLGGLVSGLGVDEHAFAKVLSGVLPAEAPRGFVDDGRGSLRREVPKVGRNEPCPCGSAKKYKKCHGRK